MTAIPPHDTTFLDKYLTSWFTEILSQRKEDPPQFILKEVPDCPDHRKQFIGTADFGWNGEKYEVSGIRASSKQNAKHFASGAALNYLGFTQEWLTSNKNIGTAGNFVWPTVTRGSVQAEEPKTVTLDTPDGSPETSTDSGYEGMGWDYLPDKDYIQILGNYCDSAVAVELGMPDYQCIEQTGPPHNPTFTMKCTVLHGNNLKPPEEIQVTERSNKKQVKRLAAFTMLKKLVRQYGQIGPVADWAPLDRPGNTTMSKCIPLSRPAGLNRGTTADRIQHQMREIALGLNGPEYDLSPWNAMYPNASPRALYNQHWELIKLLNAKTLDEVKANRLKVTPENAKQTLEQIVAEVGQKSSIKFYKFGSEAENRALALPKMHANSTPEKKEDEYDGRLPQCLPTSLTCKVGRFEYSFLGFGDNDADAEAQASEKMIRFFLQFYMPSCPSSR